MSLCNKLIVLVFILLSVHTEAAPRDEPDGYAPLEPALVNVRYPRGTTEAELESLSLDDPKLRIAYVALANVGALKAANNPLPHMRAALNDLRRRGDAATPLLLDIMDKNQNTSYEHAIPDVAKAVGTIKMGPYVDYFRRMIQTRPMEINASAFESATELFFVYGTTEDLDLVKKLAVRRPYLADALERTLELMNRWAARKKSSGTLPNPDDAKRVWPPAPVDKPNGKTAIPPAALAIPAPTSGESVPLLGGWALWGGIAAVLVVIAALALKRRAS